MEKIKIPEICDTWHASGMFYVLFPYPKTDHRYLTLDDPFTKWCAENNIGNESFNHPDVIKSDNSVFVKSELAHQIFEI